MYCVNCEFPVTYEEKMANKCSHCGKHPDHEGQKASPDSSVSGRILYLVEKIIDHTKEGGNEIAGWRMAAIREAANEIETELSK